MPSRATSSSERARQDRHDGDPVAVGSTIRGEEPVPTDQFEARAAFPSETGLALTDLLGSTVTFDSGRTARVTAALIDDTDRPVLLRVEVGPFGGTAYLPVAVLESCEGVLRTGGVHVLMRGPEIAFYENQGLKWVSAQDASKSIVDDVSMVGARGNVRF
jgi:hypothetical protein